MMSKVYILETPISVMYKKCQPTVLNPFPRKLVDNGNNCLEICNKNFCTQILAVSLEGIIVTLNVIVLTDCGSL